MNGIFYLKKGLITRRGENVCEASPDISMPQQPRILPIYLFFVKKMHTSLLIGPLHTAALSNITIFPSEFTSKLDLSFIILHFVLFNHYHVFLEVALQIDSFVQHLWVPLTIAASIISI